MINNPDQILAENMEKKESIIEIEQLVLASWVMPVVTILAIVAFILVSAAIYLQFGGPKQ